MGTDHRNPRALSRIGQGVVMLRYLRGLLVRLLHLGRRSKAERELAEELESALQLHIDDNIKSGMSPKESRRIALVKFGGIEAMKEAWRDRKRIPFLEVVMRDARYALRMMRKSPGFAITVVL